jgi:hypothetical protein
MVPLKGFLLESKDPLIQLANTIDWAIFDNAFAKYYSKDNGAPSGVKEVLAAKIILGTMVAHLLHSLRFLSR